MFIAVLIFLFDEMFLLFLWTDMDKLTSAIELAESLLKTLSEEPCQVGFFLFYENVHCHLFKPWSDVKKWFKNDFCFL